MPTKRSPSKGRSASRGRANVSETKTPVKSRSSTKKSSSVKKPIAKTPQKQKSKSRSRSASRKANTTPAQSATHQRRNAGTFTPVARPSRSRSRTRAEQKQPLAQRFSTTPVTTTQPTSSVFEDQSRPRRGVATQGTDAANVSARTARYVAKSAQNAPWRVCQWFDLAKQSVVQKWRRSCLHRPNIAKTKRHFSHNGKWYISLIVVILLAVVAYKFQRELLIQFREIQTQLNDFVETQRNIFG